MAKAIVTPNDLRRFAGILKDNIDDFDRVEHSMTQKLHNYDWQDEVATRFKGDFEAIKEPLNNLKQKMEAFIPHLEEKAQIMETEYLG
ncbi:MAG: hypothetical protein FWG84_01475 [Bacteroidales bacterium]|nr:hypothetical protein [Bacteroidales bacterium]